MPKARRSGNSSSPAQLHPCRAASPRTTEIPSSGWTLITHRFTDRRRAHALKMQRRLAKLDRDLGGAFRQAFPAREGHAGPAPAIELSRSTRRFRRNAGLTPCSRSSRHFGAVNPPARAAPVRRCRVPSRTLDDATRRVAVVTFRRRTRRRTIAAREDLHQVIPTMSRAAGPFVVRRGADAHGLGRRDLHVVDVRPRPAQHAVGEAEHQQVLTPLPR